MKLFVIVKIMSFLIITKDYMVNHIRNICKLQILNRHNS